MLELTPHSGQKPFKKLFDWGVLFPYVAQVVRSEKFEYRQVGDPLKLIKPVVTLNCIPLGHRDRAQRCCTEACN